MIRKPETKDTESLLQLAESTGIFQPGEVAALLGEVLRSYHAGELGEDHHILVWAEEGSLEAWTYLAASDKAPGVWDLWWIGVSPESHRTGIGTRLLEAVEEIVRAQQGRVLIIETNSTPAFAATRRFYLARGYLECGTIPDFYAAGENKVTYAKSFSSI